jgi:hypothetical protein
VGYKTLLSISAFLVLTSFIVALVVVKDPSFYIERWLSRVNRPIDDVETLSYWLGSKRYNLKPTVNMILFGLGSIFFALATSSAFSSIAIFFNDIVLLTPSVIFAIFMFRSLFGSFSYIIVERWLGSWRGGDAIKIASFVRAVLVLLLLTLLLTLAITPSIAPIIAVVLLSAVAFSWSIYSVDRSTIIMDYSPEGSIGFHGALRRSGIVVGNLLSGFIPMMFGFNFLFIMASILFLFSFIIFWRSIS